MKKILKTSAFLIKTKEILIFIMIFLSGCNSLPFRKAKISEGIITFEIKYPETEAGDLLAGILPNEMTLKFKNDNTLGEFNAGMGVFKTSLLANSVTKELVQMVKIMNKKYFLKLDSTEIGSLYSELPEMKIHLVKETREIAGYTCHKAIVTFKDNIKDEFAIYYTNDIDVKNSNWFSPFSEIPGVLLEYQLRKYNIEMRLTAKNVSDEKIDDKEFEIPPQYEPIKKEEMDKIFDGFKEI